MVKSVKSSSSASLGTDKHGRKVKQCQFCKKKSSDPSPLVSARPDDKDKGLHPWRGWKDRKALIDNVIVIVSDPDGNTCSVCGNVYRISGILVIVWLKLGLC